MDENQNGIVAPEIDGVQFDLSPMDGVEESNQTDRNQKTKTTENPLEVLAMLSPLEPLAVTALRKGKGARQASAFKDIEKTIPSDKMQKQIAK